MRHKTAAAILGAVRQPPEITAAGWAQGVQWTIAEQAIEILGLFSFMAWEKLTFSMLKEGISAFFRLHTQALLLLIFHGKLLSANKKPQALQPADQKTKQATRFRQEAKKIAGVSDSACLAGITVTCSRGISPHSTVGICRRDPLVSGIIFYQHNTGNGKKQEDFQRMTKSAYQGWQLLKSEYNITNFIPASSNPGVGRRPWG